MQLLSIFMMLFLEASEKFVRNVKPLPFNTLRIFEFTLQDTKYKKQPQGLISPTSWATFPIVLRVI